MTNTAAATRTPASGGDPITSGPSSASVTVTPGPTLAVTGGEITTSVIGIAILLLIGGGVLMIVRRRREGVSTDWIDEPMHPGRSGMSSRGSPSAGTSDPPCEWGWEWIRALAAIQMCTPPELGTGSAHSSGAR